MSDALPRGRWATLCRDAKTLRHLLLHPVRGETHSQRLEAFYEGQAEGYDQFRARLLHGRQELIESIEFPAGGVWVDFGAGTGENLLFAGPQRTDLREIHLVDLSKSLLRVAEQRIARHAFENATTLLADVTEDHFAEDSVDVVTFSYSLTMIPNWFHALRQAERILKPGGRIAVVDFYVSSKHAAGGLRQHGWLRRAFWSHWFAADNVFLTGDHLAALRCWFESERLVERLGSVPYLPLMKAPHYLFWGRKPKPPGAAENKPA